MQHTKFYRLMFTLLAVTAAPALGGRFTAAGDEVRYRIGKEREPGIAEILLITDQYPRLKGWIRPREEPKDAEAYFNRGFAYADSGEHEKAIEAYKQAIALWPKWATAHYDLG